MLGIWEDVSARGDSLPILELQGFGGFIGNVEHDDEVIGEVPATHRQDFGAPYRAFDVDGDIGGAMTNVNEHHAQVLFLLGEHGLGGRQGSQHQVVNFNVRFLHTADQVLTHVAGSSDDVRLHI